MVNYSVTGIPARKEDNTSRKFACSPCNAPKDHMSSHVS